MCDGVLSEVRVSNEDVWHASAFDEFVSREFDQVLALALAVLRDDDDALEVAQETMARVFERWHAIAKLDRPGAWSRRVALNLVTDKLRRRSRRRRLQARLAAEPHHVSRASSAESWDDAFWSEVAALPRRQRDVTVLHYVLDLAVAEIAVIVQAPEGTVKSDLSRARDRLRARLVGDES